MTLRIERYKHTRHWALYDGAALVVVTVYRRGGPGGPRPARPRGESGGRLTPRPAGAPPQRLAC